MKPMMIGNAGRFAMMIGALAANSSVFAATITQTLDTGQLTTNVTNDPLTFSDFNSALGTLNSVTVTLGGNVERDLIFKNTSTSSGGTLSVINWTTSFSLVGPDGTFSFFFEQRDSELVRGGLQHTARQSDGGR